MNPITNLIAKNLGRKQTGVIRPRPAASVRKTDVVSFLRKPTSEEMAGGKGAIIAKTAHYTIFSLVIAPYSSTGLRKIVKGSRSLVLMTGVGHLESRGKDPRILRLGDHVEFGADSEYAISTDAFAAEFLAIDSVDVFEKVLRPGNLGELPEESKLSVLKARPSVSLEERESLGEKLRRAGGFLEPKQKRNVISDLVHQEAAQRVFSMGSNPRPLSDAELDGMSER